MFSAVSAISGRHVGAGLEQQGLGRGLGEAAAGAHGDQVVFGLHHVAVAGDDQRGILVGHSEHGFQTAQERSVRQSFASSTAARTRWPRCFSS